MQSLDSSGCVIFFFFKQKTAYEIGVTGVQTCALPISARGPPVLGGVVGEEALGQRLNVLAPLAQRRDVYADDVQAVEEVFAEGATPDRVVRSEERRVGKECRSCWSTEQHRKEQLEETTLGQRM